MEQNQSDIVNDKESQSEESAPDMGFLSKSLVEEKEKAESYLLSWQRAQADFVNYKRRTEQEKDEYSRNANASLILKILPVMDDLERALKAIPAHKDEKTWSEGIILIMNKLKANLESVGLSEIKSVGEQFDPNLHEAVMTAKGKEGVVTAEMQKGYRLFDRVIRPAAVVVGNGEEEQNKEEE